MAVNATEEFVERICRKSFLSMWSIANPRGKQATKELCDVLIVCDPHVVILSVKNVALKRTDNLASDHGRWLRRAIDESAHQISGACRWLGSATHVNLAGGLRGPNLPPVERRIVHRVAVAFGSEGEIAFASKDMRGGFVHVFETILTELDTVTDFTGYLSAKKRLLDQGGPVVIEGTEKDLLALYLLNNRTFPNHGSMLIVANDLWNGYCLVAEAARKTAENLVSYVWDEVIERMAAELIEEHVTDSSFPTDGEFLLRQMAREPRYSRRELGKKLADFASPKTRAEIRARVVQSYTEGVAYVFLNATDEADREATKMELCSRCYMVRGLVPNTRVVLGIAFEWNTALRKYRTMQFRFEPDDWTEKDDRNVREGVEVTGWFKNANWSTYRSDILPGEPIVLTT